MHLIDMSVGHLGSNAIVGGHIPIATGAAMWVKSQGEDRVVVSFFGDGATSEGAFHESVNFAGVFGLPVVFVVENNHWAMSLPWSHETAQPSIAEKARAYGIAGRRRGRPGRARGARGGRGGRRAGADAAAGRPCSVSRPTGSSATAGPIPSAYRDKPRGGAVEGARPDRCSTSARLAEAGGDDVMVRPRETEVLDEIDAAVAGGGGRAHPPRLDEVFADIYATPIGGSR